VDLMLDLACPDDPEIPLSLAPLVKPYSPYWYEEPADGDDLTVEDLIREAAMMSEAELHRKRQVALDEPLLSGNVISRDTRTTGVNVTLQYPEQSLTEVPEADLGVVTAVEPAVPTGAEQGVQERSLTTDEPGLTDLPAFEPSVDDAPVIGAEAEEAIESTRSEDLPTGEDGEKSPQPVADDS